MPDPVSSPPRYLAAVLAAAGDAPVGRVTDVFVLHDDGCPLLAGSGPCGCSPVVTRGFVLWFRKGRRAKWEDVATRPTERQCYDAMNESGRRHGEWLVLPAGKQP